MDKLPYTLCRGVVLVCFAGILLVLLYTSWSFGPEGAAAKGVLWLLLSSGLLLVASGLIRGHRRSYIWFCFILLFYFIGFIQALFAVSGVATVGQAMPSSAATHEWLAVGFIVVGFIASMFASRRTPMR